MTRLFLLAGGFFGMTAVLLGAFGAHALKARISPEELGVFETGARYQMYHALALIAVAWLSSRSPSPLWSLSGSAFTAGIILFSGSLYLLACRNLLGLAHWTWLGPVTPLGGFCFLAGWLILLVAAWRLKEG